MLKHIRVTAEYKIGLITHVAGPYCYSIKTRAKTVKGLNSTALKAARKIFPNASNLEVIYVS